MKLLVWLVLLLLLVLAVRSKVRGLRKAFDKTGQTGSSRGTVPQVGPAENMVACAHCQLYLPASEALYSDAHGERQYFCCQEHLRGMQTESA